MKSITLVLLLIATSAWAKPASFEVWFLSIDKAAVFNEFSPFKTPKSVSIAQAGLQCQPMGEYCFDPQIGLYKKENGIKAIDSTVDQAVVDDANKYEYMKAGDSVNQNLINCDEENGFNLFCGKSIKGSGATNINLEVWIDVSTTMKQVDFSGFDKKCTRELFLERLNQTCPMNQKMKVYYFNEVRKEAGSFDRACISNGLNNMKRILADIKLSSRKNIVIVTDIFEANQEFISELESMGGVTRGLDSPIYAKDLLTNLTRIRKMCK